VKVKLIKKEIAEGNIPVISPVAEGYDGKPYNVNADLVAGRVASALHAPPSRVHERRAGPAFGAA
jgi:acetylglutamate kinase